MGHVGPTGILIQQPADARNARRPPQVAWYRILSAENRVIPSRHSVSIHRFQKSFTPSAYIIGAHD